MTQDIISTNPSTSHSMECPSSCPCWHPQRRRITGSKVSWAQGGPNAWRFKSPHPSSLLSGADYLSIYKYRFQGSLGTVCAECMVINCESQHPSSLLSSACSRALLVSDSMIQKMGRWSSTTWLQYLHGQISCLTAWQPQCYTATLALGQKTNFQVPRFPGHTVCRMRGDYS
jgi:hypothetical protein